MQKAVILLDYRKRMVNKITRKSLKDVNLELIHPARSIAQCDVYTFEIEDKKYILKDYNQRHNFLKNTWGKFIILREFNVYNKLEGIDGIPRVFNLLDDYGFVMEFIKGERLPKSKDNFLTKEFFEKLSNIIKRMHKRGISHGDLRRKNILVDENMQPYLIDFASAFRLKNPNNYIYKKIFKRLCNVDNITVIKLKKHYVPDSLTAKERHLLENKPFYLKFGQFLKKKVYRHFKKRNRKKIIEKIKNKFFGG